MSGDDHTMSQAQTHNLASVLSLAATLLNDKQEEQDLSKEELKEAVQVHKKLHSLLSLATRTDDYFLRPAAAPTTSSSNNALSTDFSFSALQDEMEQAKQDQSTLQKSHPAAVRPLTHEALADLNGRDFFILDNSLRETTVGSAKGHCLEEKHKIIDAIAETGIQEVILGAFGSKISVDSQIAARWGDHLGLSFDHTWGFSDAFDLDSYEEEPILKSLQHFKETKHDVTDDIEYFTPNRTIKTTYNDNDEALFRKAAIDFRSDAFPGVMASANTKAQEVLKASRHATGRIPMGLLMMAGYGVSNAIIEVDTSDDKFDYSSHDLVERCKFLMSWCKQNLRQRTNAPHGEDNQPRILINLRDFSNYQRSSEGLERCLRLIDELCRLSPEERPFGFLMEDPTGWMWPDEVAQIIRMMRLTMNRAGHSGAKLLVHLHMSYGMAEACVLSALCNGADGVWSAVCKTGAQVGHASSTVTAVNLYRAGVKGVADKYNLKKMTEAAREVTRIVTREECPDQEEVYGKHAFDEAFWMLNVPSCRYAVANLIEELGLDDRFVRLNEISARSAIERAMTYHFGTSEEGGWESEYCHQMWDAINNHLLTGLSRDYNSPLGLGQLYALVSQKNLSEHMVGIMLESSKVSDSHPTVIEFVHRWNRLCDRYLGKEKPSPICTSKSIMMPLVDVTLEPRLKSLPLKILLQDFFKNPATKRIPSFLRKRLIAKVLEEEKMFRNSGNPVLHFDAAILRLKLFIEEAESFGVLPLVEDFIMRRQYDRFFGEGDDWLADILGERPRSMVMDKVKPAFFMLQYPGNHGILRAMKTIVQRMEEGPEIRSDLHFFREAAPLPQMKQVLSTVEHCNEGSSFLCAELGEMATKLFSDLDKTDVESQSSLGSSLHSHDNAREAAYYEDGWKTMAKGKKTKNTKVGKMLGLLQKLQKAKMLLPPCDDPLCVSKGGAAPRSWDPRQLGKMEAYSLPATVEFDDEISI